MCNLKSVKGLLAPTLISWIIFIQESEDKKYNVRQVSHKSSLTCIGKGWQSKLKNISGFLFSHGNCLENYNYSNYIIANFCLWA